ncbi:MAG: hypothetical protein GEU77_09560 [Deltaproteobacteria bacterium]|nr:hypothetical protein [Deltaproteobacteria bacterium]
MTLRSCLKGGSFNEHHRESLTDQHFALLFVLFAGSLWAQSESMDERYKKALKEGGTLNFYGTLAQINAKKILPVFEKHFPGIRINHVDATSDKLVTRAIAEARGGKTIADVLQVNLSDAIQAHDQRSFPAGRAADRRAGRGLFYLLFSSLSAPDPKRGAPELYADRRSGGHRLHRRS